MSTWLYQINQKMWSPERYRIEIWEGEKWVWTVGSRSSAGKSPDAGDTVVFFYAPSSGKDSGFYGWAVVLEWLEENHSLYFRPVAPSDHLKMHPWWDNRASALADEIRGRMKQKTMWLIPAELVPAIRFGITSWLSADGSSGAVRPRV